MITKRTQPKLLSIDDIITPCYVIDSVTLKSNIDDLICSFKKFYNKFILAYSFKTSTIPYVCNAVLEAGGYAEVVSPFEYKLAKKLGFDNKIIFNGVIKDYYSKLELIKNGGIVNVDSLIELSDFAEYAENHHKHINIGIRFNFDIDNNNTTQFGIELNNDNINRIKSYLSPYLNIVSVHCHISCRRQLRYWKQRIDKMIEVAKIFNAKYIDLGGNMYSHMHPDVKKHFEIKTGEPVPTFEEYAKVIAESLNTNFPDKKPTLIIEPGTPVIANAMSMITTIMDIKGIADKYYAILDTSSLATGLLTKCLSAPIKTLSKSFAEPQHWCLCGNTCMFGDTILEDYYESLQIGQKLEIQNIGAYSYGLSPVSFITPPARMYVNEGDSYTLIKREGNLEDILKPFEDVSKFFIIK